MSTVFPGFDDLFELSDPLLERPFRGDFAFHDGSVALSRNEASVSEPVAVGWAMGEAKPSDLIWTTSAHPVLIHERVRQLLSNEGFRGWSTYPVVVRSKAGQPLANYHGLSIGGRCGARDLARSAVVVEEYPGGWFPHFAGHYFDANSWDGSDFFMEDRDALGMVTTTRLVTGRVVRAFARERIRNVQFTRLDQISVRTSVFELTRARLLPADFQDRVGRAYETAGVPRPKGDSGG